MMLVNQIPPAHLPSVYLFLIFLGFFVARNFARRFARDAQKWKNGFRQPVFLGVASLCWISALTCFGIVLWVPPKPAALLVPGFVLEAVAIGFLLLVRRLNLQVFRKTEASDLEPAANAMLRLMASAQWAEAEALATVALARPSPHPALRLNAVSVYLYNGKREDAHKLHQSIDPASLEPLHRTIFLQLGQRLDRPPGRVIEISFVTSLVFLLGICLVTLSASARGTADAFAAAAGMSIYFVFGFFSAIRAWLLRYRGDAVTIRSVLDRLLKAELFPEAAAVAEARLGRAPDDASSRLRAASARFEAGEPELASEHLAHLPEKLEQALQVERIDLRKRLQSKV